MADLRNGSRSLRETLRNPPACLHKVTVYALVIGSYNMGPTGASRVLSDCGVSPLTRIEECPDYVRGRIINQLPKRAT